MPEPRRPGQLADGVPAVRDGVQPAEPRVVAPGVGLVGVPARDSVDPPPDGVVGRPARDVVAVGHEGQQQRAEAARLHLRVDEELEGAVTQRDQVLVERSVALQRGQRRVRAGVPHQRVGRAQVVDQRGQLRVDTAHRTTSRMLSSTTPHRVSRSSSPIASGGISTTTSPSGRTQTPAPPRRLADGEPGALADRRDLDAGHGADPTDLAHAVVRLEALGQLADPLADARRAARPCRARPSGRRFAIAAAQHSGLAV